jgi:hypothetical protein
MRKSIICWDFLIASNVICFGFFFFFTAIWPTISGFNIFAINYWLDLLKALTPLNTLLFLLGLFYSHFYTIYIILSNFERPILCIFTEQDIYLYSLCGTKKIPWRGVSLFEIKQIENSPGHVSKSFKFFEVSLQYSIEKQLKFQFETFSDTKLSKILDVWTSFQIRYQFESEESK